MKIKIIGITLLSLTVSLFLFATVAGAQAFRTGEVSTVASGETIDGAAYLAGSTVNVAGTINGDLHCAAQNVTISGDIDGDILCAAQTINITGRVTGNVRLAAQTITVSGEVGRSATIAGQTVTIDGRGSIGQDVTIASQIANVNGAVARDAVIGATTVTVNTTIGRNVTADVDMLTVGGDARVAGTLDYTSSRQFSKADNAVISGKVTYHYTDREKTANANAYNPLATFVWLLMLITSAIIFVLLFPRVPHRVTSESVASVSRAWLTVLVGFVTAIVMPFLVVILALTMLGLPFALVAGLAWVLILAISGVFTAYYIGRVVWRNQHNAVLTMLTGAAILAILLVIPIINIFVALLSLWYGSGAVLIYLRGLYTTPRYDMSGPIAIPRKT